MTSSEATCINTADDNIRLSRANWKTETREIYKKDLKEILQQKITTTKDREETAL
jgi:hypothetical protein